MGSVFSPGVLSEDLETYIHRDSLGFCIIVLRLTAAWAAVTRLEKHLLSSCHTEHQNRFTVRPIRQVLMSPPSLLSTSVWMSLLHCKQAAYNLSTDSKIFYYLFQHRSVCSQIYGKNSFAELTQPGIWYYPYELSAQPDSAMFVAAVAHWLPVGQPTAA